MISDRVIDVVTFAAAIGSGVIGGVFYAFSTFVMKALDRLPAHQSLAAMQAINIAVINPMFLGVFLATAATSAAAAIMHLGRLSAAWTITGAALYIVGTFLVTMVCNVPLNNTMAAISLTDPTAAEGWQNYRRRWSCWNHIRTAAAIGALGSFLLALRY